MFAKAEGAQVQVSPLGKWLGWLARTNGSLNLWVAPLPLSPEKCGSNKIPGARQLTFVADGRDVCFTWRFTRDDTKIIYLRETKHGSELYHLYSLDLIASDVVVEGRDLLAAYPHLTCSVGFVGGLQLWLPSSTPNVVILSTGRGSLLWDLSMLNLDTGVLSTVYQNPASTWRGLAALAATLLLHLAVKAICAVCKILTAGIVDLSESGIAPPPAAPLQFFVSPLNGSLVGAAECEVSLGGIALRFSRWSSSRWSVICPAVPFARLNMQLVGSGAAAGTMRFDVLSEGDCGGGGFSVALHTCDAGDKTAYVRYPGGEILAQSAMADLEGFLVNPQTGMVEAAVATAARLEILPIPGGGGGKLVRALEALREALLLEQQSMAGNDDLVVMVVSRTLVDDLWVIRASSDTNAGTFFLVRNPYGHAKNEMEAVMHCPRG